MVNQRLKPANVRVPAALLLDRRLLGSAKLLWMILQLEEAVADHEPIPMGRLRARSGLDPHTIRRALAQLRSTGWLGIAPDGNRTAAPGWASTPADLLLDDLAGIQERLLYGIVQLTPGFQGPTGRFTYAELGDLAGLSPNAVKRAVRRLREKGWIETSQGQKFSPVRFTLRNPATERHKREVIEARRRLEEASFLGEAIMREYLSLIVDSDEYDDDASPGFLVNAFTGEEMQFDRYYPPRVAFEFNGPQHYGPTSRYVNESEARKQQGRDHLKAGICALRGIRLVVVHPEDLTLAGMRRKVDDLPLRSLAGHEPLISFLESVSRAYCRKARRGGAVRPAPTPSTPGTPSPGRNR